MENLIPFPLDPIAFLAWLATPAAAAVIIALVLERITAWRNWRSPWKGRAVVALFVLLPYVAAGLQLLAARVDPQLVAGVSLVLAWGLQGLFAWSASQYAHDADPGRTTPPLQ